jgi:hypothetical protein
MPDKQNESKFMAMLERRGMIRKTGSEDEFMEAGQDGADNRERAEADLRSMFNQPAGDTVIPTPTARQPVPGIINPAGVAERSSQLEREQSRSAYHVGQEQPMPIVRVQAEPPRSVGRAELEQPRRVDIQKPPPFYGGTDNYDDIPMKEQHVAPHVNPFTSAAHPAPGTPVTQSAPYAPGAPFAPVAPPVYERAPEPPPVENYTAIYLDIEELYEALSLRSKRTDTIYLIEEYLKTLPESLPDESRREIVGKIVAASGFDFDLLIGDGVLRVKMLKEYAERFAKYTDDFVSARNAEVDELEQQIMRIRRQTENRRDLHKKQFFAIEAEAQRLKDILTFISG